MIEIVLWEFEGELYSTEVVDDDEMSTIYNITPEE